ncbi:MAG: hypothetical protein CMP23_10830 [Rickettsiales bacterium]|nr:hypothetical protein [Rickettsiales bacterium]|tara:strand:+ start:3223 stop:4488 length:1266 start_codon:yes stop_codon:yes gene_type:complete
MIWRLLVVFCPGIFLLTSIAAGCVSDVSQTPARAPLPGELLISQLYTSGALPAGGTDHYFSDQFVELVNVASVPLDLSGVRLADVFGSAGEINPGMVPDSFRDERPDEVVLSSVWALPNGTRLEPNQVLVIAHDGGNHRPFSDLDLSSADFEAYVESSQGDEDYPTVANLESVVFNGGLDWLMTVFGPSVVLLDALSPLDQQAGPFGPLPVVSVDAVLDGIDTLMDSESAAFKRLPELVDSGFAWVEGPYTGTALHRRRVDGLWQDTNDSSVDFAVGDPQPTRPFEADGVFGEPFVQLGGGAFSWEPREPGEDMELVAGSQGGWHLDVSLWFGGFGPGGVQLSYEAVDGAATRVSFPTQAELYEASVVPADEGWYRFGDRIVLDIQAPEEVLGEELILRVTAALEEQTWSDEVRVRVVDAE